MAGDDASGVEAAVRGVESRGSLAAAVRLLARDFDAERWENITIPEFLEATAWIDDMDGCHANQGLPRPERPDWRTFVEILAAARVYE